MNTIIAHRGASYLSKHDNTMESFQLAIDMHAEVIELDVRITLDKVLVVFHDEQIAGTPIKALTYQQLTEITQPMQMRIPSLEEVLLLCHGHAKLLIELKETGYERYLVTLVNRYYDYSEYKMQSFLDICVRRVKKADPNVEIGLLIGLKHADFRTKFNEYFPYRRAKECHADFLSVHHRIATAEFILRMKRCRYPLYVWTVDSPRDISLFLDSEIEGIITNRPDLGIFLRAKWENEDLKSKTRRANVYHVLKGMIPGQNRRSRKAITLSKAGEESPSEAITSEPEDSASAASNE